jgi:hypothetical protein
VLEAGVVLEAAVVRRAQWFTESAVVSRTAFRLAASRRNCDRLWRTSLGSMSSALRWWRAERSLKASFTRRAGYRLEKVASCTRLAFWRLVGGGGRG